MPGVGVDFLDLEGNGWAKAVFPVGGERLKLNRCFVEPFSQKHGPESCCTARFGVSYRGAVGQGAPVLCGGSMQAVASSTQVEGYRRPGSHVFTVASGAWDFQGELKRRSNLFERQVLLLWCVSFSFSFLGGRGGEERSVCLHTL